jgi:hypothetical protein
VFGVEYAPYPIKLIADTLTEMIVPSGREKGEDERDNIGIKQDVATEDPSQFVKSLMYDRSLA